MVEFVSVSDVVNNVKHIVRLVRVLRDYVVQKFIRSLIGRVLFSPKFVGSFISTVLGQVTHKFSGASNRFNIVLEDFMADSRDLTVHFGSSKLLFGYIFICYCFNNLGAGNKHVT